MNDDRITLGRVAALLAAGAALWVLALGSVLAVITEVER
jgi:hypothetical protein